MDMNDVRIKMTAVDYLRELANRESTDNIDDMIVQAIIIKLQYRGKVVSGFIYLEPYNREPISIGDKNEKK